MKFSPHSWHQEQHTRRNCVHYSTVKAINWLLRWIIIVRIWSAQLIYIRLITPWEMRFHILCTAFWKNCLQQYLAPIYDDEHLSSSRFTPIKLCHPNYIHRIHKIQNSSQMGLLKHTNNVIVWCIRSQKSVYSIAPIPVFLSHIFLAEPFCVVQLIGSDYGWLSPESQNRRGGLFHKCVKLNSKRAKI